MFMEGLGLESSDRANKAALLLAHDRYTRQFAPFVKGQASRLSYLEPQIEALLDECAAETNGDPDYVKDRFSVFLRETVKSEIPESSTGIKNDNPSDLGEFTKTDVMDRGEVPGAGLQEALDIPKQNLDEHTLPYDQLAPKGFNSVAVAQIKEAMTAKDFVLIASVLAANNADPVLVDAFADALMHTNPMFDRDRFVAAASGSPMTKRDAPREAPVTIPEDDGYGPALAKCARCEEHDAAEGSDVCAVCSTVLRAKAAYGDDLAFTGEDMYDMFGENGPDEDDVAGLNHMWDKNLAEQIDQLHQEIEHTSDPEEKQELYARLGELQHRLDKGNTRDMNPDQEDDYYDREVDPHEYAERNLHGGSSKEGDANWTGDSELVGPAGTGTGAEHDPTAQGLVQPDQPDAQYTCTICGQQGTQQDMLQHVQQDHGDVLQRIDQQQQTQPQPQQGTGYPGTGYPMAASVKEADPAQGDQQPAQVDPLPQSPGDRFDGIVQDLAERAAARKFSLPTDEDFHLLASQLSIPEDQIRQHLQAIAIFGNYAGVNGELSDNSSPPQGYEAVSLPNQQATNAQVALVPTDLVVSKVAEDMNLTDNLAYDMIRDRYGDDLPETYHANVQGQQTFYLPTELAGNQTQNQPAQYDPTVGPAFQQTPPGAPVPQQAAPPAQPGTVPQQ